MSFDTFPMSVSGAINLGDTPREEGIGVGTSYSFTFYPFLAYAQARATFP